MNIFSFISWRAILFVETTRVPGEYQQTTTSNKLDHIKGLFLNTEFEIDI